METPEWAKDAIENKALKFAVLVLLPLAYGFMLQHTQTVTSGSLATPTLSSNNSLDFQSVQGEVGVPDSVNAIFPLAKYFSFWPLVSFRNAQMCFEDNGSYVSYLNGTRLPASIEWSVDLNGQNVTVLPYSENCTPVEIGGTYNYTWVGDLYFLINQNSSLSDVRVFPVTRTYHSFEYDYGLLQGLVLVPVLYLVFWYPLFGIIRKIEKGWKEQ
jgi:hypothetical protein